MENSTPNKYILIVLSLIFETKSIEKVSVKVKLYKGNQKVQWEKPRQSGGGTSWFLETSDSCQELGITLDTLQHIMSLTNNFVSSTFSLNNGSILELG